MNKNNSVQLFTPGPVNVLPSVLAAGARPMLHHRTPDFSMILKSLLDNLKILIGTKQAVLPVHTTGRGAMEGCILNLFSQGDEIASVCNGKFGEMFADIAELHSLKVNRICREWQKEISLEEIEETLKTNTNIKAITVCHSETTTAVEANLEAIGQITNKYNVLLIVDGISSVGCLPIEFDKWNIDVLVTASQKGLMSPPGISFVTLSERAWRFVETSKLHSYYIQFKPILKNITAENPETPGSTPVSLVACVEEALQIINAEGRDNVIARHAKVASAIRVGIQAMGLELFPRNVKARSNAVTAVLVPDGFTSGEIRSRLKAHFGIQAAAGLGKDYKDKVIRIGHMGYVTEKDAITFMGAFEVTLYELGVIKELGAGITATMRDLVKE